MGRGRTVVPSEHPKPRKKKPRRKGRSVVVGLALIGAGLLVFRFSSLIASYIGGYVSPPPQGAEAVALGGQVGFVDYGVWAFGISLLGLGANMLRGAFMSAAMGGGAAAGISAEMLDGYMQQAMSATHGVSAQVAAATTPKEVVKVKCRNCGSLEAEDAAFCRKCGKAM